MRGERPGALVSRRASRLDSPVGPEITASTTWVETPTSSERAAEASMPAPEASKLPPCRRSSDVRSVLQRAGTHLAAMVAYFALASFVPLIFLALSVLGFLDQADSSSALVSYLEDVFPGQSVESIVSFVDAVQRNATTLSVVGAVALLWSSLSLFSSLESAFNIVYGRPNRPFLRGKASPSCTCPSRSSSSSSA